MAHIGYLAFGPPFNQPSSLLPSVEAPPQSEDCGRHLLGCQSPNVADMTNSLRLITVRFLCQSAHRVPISAVRLCNFPGTRFSFISSLLHHSSHTRALPLVVGHMTNSTRAERSNDSHSTPLCIHWPGPSRPSARSRAWPLTPSLAKDPILCNQHRLGLRT